MTGWYVHKHTKTGRYSLQKYHVHFWERGLAKVPQEGRKSKNKKAARKSTAFLFMAFFLTQSFSGSIHQQQVWWYRHLSKFHHLVFKTQSNNENSLETVGLKEDQDLITDPKVTEKEVKNTGYCPNGGSEPQGTVQMSPGRIPNPKNIRIYSLSCEKETKKFTSPVN